MTSNAKASALSFARRAIEAAQAKIDRANILPDDDTYEAGQAIRVTYSYSGVTYTTQIMSWLIDLDGAEGRVNALKVTTP